MDPASTVASAARSLHHRPRVGADRWAARCPGRRSALRAHGAIAGPSLSPHRRHRARLRLASGCPDGGRRPCRAGQLRHPYRDEPDLDAVLPHVDVVYQTRVQKERFTTPEEYETARGQYVIDGMPCGASARRHPAPPTAPRRRDRDRGRRRSPRRLFPPGAQRRLHPHGPSGALLRTSRKDNQVSAQCTRSGFSQRQPSSSRPQTADVDSRPPSALVLQPRPGQLVHPLLDMRASCGRHGRQEGATEHLEPIGDAIRAVVQRCRPVEQLHEHHFEPGAASRTRRCSGSTTGYGPALVKYLPRRAPGRWRHDGRDVPSAAHLRHEPATRLERPRHGSGDLCGGDIQCSAALEKTASTGSSSAKSSPWRPRTGGVGRAPWPGRSSPLRRRCPPLRHRPWRFAPSALRSRSRDRRSARLAAAPAARPRRRPAW